MEGGNHEQGAEKAPETNKYPSYDITKVLGYTNKQIRYYVQTVPMSPAEQKALSEALVNRKALMQTIRWDGSSDPEDSEQDDNEEPTPSQSERSQTARPRVMGARARRLTRQAAPKKYTYYDDGEPDSDFPEVTPGIKGLKVEKITKLKTNSNRTNFKAWENDLRRAFKGDPNRFFDGQRRVIFGLENAEENFKSMFGASLAEFPMLETHWRKFLRWTAETVLAGDSDRMQALSLFSSSYQQEWETPAEFYTRYIERAYRADATVSIPEFFSRLNENLQRQLTKSGDAETAYEPTAQPLIQKAQRMWGTLRVSERRTKRLENIDKDGNPKPIPEGNDTSGNTDKNGGQRGRGRFRGGSRGRGNGRGNGQENPGGRQGNGRNGRGRGGNRNGRGGRGGSRHRYNLSAEEEARRKEKNLCLNCGKPGHYGANCESSFNPDSTDYAKVDQASRKRKGRQQSDEDREDDKRSKN